MDDRLRADLQSQRAGLQRNNRAITLFFDVDGGISGFPLRECARPERAKNNCRKKNEDLDCGAVAHSLAMPQVNNRLCERNRFRKAQAFISLTLCHFEYPVVNDWELPHFLVEIRKRLSWCLLRGESGSPPERLRGFPSQYTLIDWKSELALLDRERLRY